MRMTMMSKSGADDDGDCDDDGDGVLSDGERLPH